MKTIKDLFVKRPQTTAGKTPASSSADGFPVVEPSRGQSPFLDAKQEWFERYGDYIQSSVQWRMVAVMALCVTGLSLTGNLIQLGQAKITPYIVEVDKLGVAAAVRPLNTGGEIPRRLVQAEITNIISNWRTVTADLELQKKLVKKLSAYVGGSATGTIREWFEHNNPYVRSENVLVSVDMTGIPLPVSTDSWRVSWRETTRNHAGITLDVTAYEATVSVIIVPPKDESQILANPGGVLVTSLSFSKTLN